MRELKIPSWLQDELVVVAGRRPHAGWNIRRKNENESHGILIVMPCMVDQKEEMKEIFPRRKLKKKMSVVWLKSKRRKVRDPWDPWTQNAILSWAHLPFQPSLVSSLATYTGWPQ